jgi:imidazole glycerol phosphate synthase subunit HisF
MKDGIPEGADGKAGFGEFAKAVEGGGYNTITTAEETIRDRHEAFADELVMLKMEADSLIHRVRAMRISKDLQDVLIMIGTEHGETTMHEAATILLGRQGADRVRQEWHRKQKFLAEYIDFLRKKHSIKNS